MERSNVECPAGSSPRRGVPPAAPHSGYIKRPSRAQAPCLRVPLRGRTRPLPPSPLFSFRFFFARVPTYTLVWSREGGKKVSRGENVGISSTPSPYHRARVSFLSRPPSLSSGWAGLLLGGACWIFWMGECVERKKIFNEL